MAEVVCEMEMAVHGALVRLLRRGGIRRVGRRSVGLGCLRYRSFARPGRCYAGGMEDVGWTALMGKRREQEMG
jgi:hypothetical protein